MNLIKHGIVNISTNKVINVVEYETEQTGCPPGFEMESEKLLCVANNQIDIGWDYVDGLFVDNRPKPEPITYGEVK